jgi:DNA-binding response OmpR family regulator
MSKARRHHGHRVLIAEDDKIVALDLKRCCERNKFDVVATLPLSGAAERLSSARVDVLLLDLSAVGESVHDAIFRLLSSNLPVVCMATDPGELPDQMRGRVPVVPKPYEEGALIAALRQAVQPQSARARGEMPSGLVVGPALNNPCPGGERP